MGRSVYIETYGCQMNESDTELMYGLLRHEGYSIATQDADADVILLNTCTVRERAEERIFGRLGWLKSLKAKRPNVVLGVTGCMAERMKEDLRKRAPYVDLIVGPDAYRRLPEMIQANMEEDPRDPQIDVRLDRRERYEGLSVDRVPRTSGWLTVQRGCDKFCAYCIVPFVRGRERSLPPEKVVAQAEEMVAQGFKEITLLGQTVSSYYEEGCDFAELLERVSAVEGLARLRFMSPYPNDFSDRLIDTLARLPNLGKHLHLPMQSGSTKILKDMRRGYTAEAFKAKVLKLKERLPRWSLTTDVIVGYPDETDEDFRATLEIMEALQFDSAFMFQYSERDGTSAARSRPDNIPHEVKNARLQELIALQEGISKVRFAAQVGLDHEALMIGPSKRDPARWIGRTSCFRTVIVDAAGLSEGDIIPVKIEGATSHTLFGVR